MPRIARKDILSNFIHVMIQGINKEYIFKDKFEIRVYLKYLQENIKDTNIKIISYCMMNNHAHFLFYFKNIEDISKLMSKVNTKYAIFYNKKNNRCGIVFRNRYKTEEILDTMYLKNCIKYIHNNPVKAGMCENAGDYSFSSYCEYKTHNGILLDWNFIQRFIRKFYMTIEDILDEYENNEKVIFMEDDDYEDKKVLKNNVLKEYMTKNNIHSINELKENNKFLKEIIFIFYSDYCLNKQEIAEILNISRFKIYRILKEL